MNRRVRSMGMDIVERGARSAQRRSVTIAANDRARTEPDIVLDGLRFDNYRRNPVVMWAHDAVGRSPSGGLPIGRTLSIGRSDEGIVAEFEFLEDDDFAQRIRNAWDKGFLRAASISWLPLESEATDDGRLRDTQSELLEWSIVSVPADPDALREAHRRMLDSLLSPSTPAARAATDAPTPGGLALTAAELGELQSAAEALGALLSRVRDVSPQRVETPTTPDLAELRALTATTRRIASGESAERSPPA